LNARLLIVGYRANASVGESLERAAMRLGLELEFMDAGRAFAAPRLISAVAWHLAGHRPAGLRAFSRKVAEACARFKPRWLLSTGISPVAAEALKDIGQLGVMRLNYLTDDPWNPRLGSRWFSDALRRYDHVFSPRSSNLDDLRRHGCRMVSYLPFGFDPDLSFPQAPDTAEEAARYAADVMFVGGADRDRVAYAAALIDAGFRVHLYGGYWQDYREARSASRGLADAATVRKATSVAKVALCLVRRANRDGHVMRSLEIPAIGACMLVEDTEEHRELFGPDGEAVRYFSTIPEMLDRLRWLLGHDLERTRLADAVHERILRGGHRYNDRLTAMLAASGVSSRVAEAVA
jgi:spore maturation protein CgeB